MKAKITKPGTYNATHNHERECIGGYTVVARRGGRMQDAVTVRFEMGRSRSAAVVHAQLWVHGDNGCSGTGRAWGWGHDKQSAALDRAIRNAGIVLTGDPYGREGADFKRNKPCSIHGCGDGSVKIALEAMARAAGFRGALYTVSF